MKGTDGEEADGQRQGDEEEERRRSGGERMERCCIINCSEMF